MSKSIQLRTMEIKDLPFLHKLYNDPEIMDYWFNEAYEQFHHLEERFKEKNDHVRLFMITNQAEEQIGFIGLYFIDPRHRHAEFAIALDPAYQGKGYAQIATRLALDYAFLSLNLHKIYLIVASSNHKAQHIYEKMGFSREGTLKEHYFIKGKYEDVEMMGLLASDYQKE